MPISVNRPAYKIPEYSLTGDILAHINCGLQYRYHNRGSLPPSTPVQLWFGEFLHGAMQEAFLEWREIPERRDFPWNWDEVIRPIELRIARRLRSRGLNSPPRVFCPYEADYDRPGLCPDEHHPHQLIASRRMEEAINIWGMHLFPLISESEVKLKGVRSMPNFRENISRSNYYSITGRVDVISSVNLESASSQNLIIQQLEANPEIQANIEAFDGPNYEIIIDYKGSRRPAISDPVWNPHDWQILTYSWLRRIQPNSNPVIAGFVLYLNELVPSIRNMSDLRQDIQRGETDVMPEQRDADYIFTWQRDAPLPVLSQEYRIARSVRTIPITETRIDSSLTNFDQEVEGIEECVQNETHGNPILTSWRACGQTRTCTACDFNTYCPNPQPSRYNVTIP